MPRVRALTADLAEQDLPLYLAALRNLTGVDVGHRGCDGLLHGSAARRCAPPAWTRGWPPSVGSTGAASSRTIPTVRTEALPRARAEFVFGHADQDRSMPAEAVEALGEALDEAGLTASNEVYAGAAHGYTMADTSMYDEPATERHFAELEELFERAL